MNDFKSKLEIYKRKKNKEIQELNEQNKSLTEQNKSLTVKNKSLTGQNKSLSTITEKCKRNMVAKKKKGGYGKIRSYNDFHNQLQIMKKKRTYKK